MDSQIESILQGGPFKKLMDEQILEVRKKYDLKRAEIEILYFLSKCGEYNTSTDIHSQLMMNKGHISQAVDSLHKKNFIRTIPDQHDRRYIHYELTDSAKEIVEEIRGCHLKINQQVLEGISEEELQVFKKVAGKIKKNIEKMIL